MIDYVNTWSHNLRPKWVGIILITCALLISAFFGGVTVFLRDLLSGRELLLLVGLLGAWPFVYFSVTRFDWMVFLSFCLFGIVQIEPAPSDLLIMFLLPLALVTGRLSLKALKDSSLVHGAIWGFLIINLLSLLFADNLLHSARYTVISVYVIMLAYFAKLYMTSAHRVRLVMTGYLISGLISMGLVALDYAGIAPSEIFVEQTRARGMFKDANVFGPFLIPLILFLLDEIWHPTLLKWPMSVKSLSMLILMGGVFLSFSRAAWGNLIIALGVYILLCLPQLSRERLMGLLKFGALGVVALVILVNVMGLGDFLAYRTTLIQTYDADRFQAQQDGLMAGVTHMFGLGPGMMDRVFFSPHSLYVRTFAEHGIFGLIILLFLLAYLLAFTGRVAVRGTEKQVGLSAKVVFAGMFALLLNSFLIDTIHWRHFWFMVGLMWVVVGQKNKAAPESAACQTEVAYL